MIGSHLRHGFFLRRALINRSPSRGHNQINSHFGCFAVLAYKVHHKKVNQERPIIRHSFRMSNPRPVGADRYESGWGATAERYGLVPKCSRIAPIAPGRSQSTTRGKQIDLSATADWTGGREKVQSLTYQTTEQVLTGFRGFTPHSSSNGTTQCAGTRRAHDARHTSVQNRVAPSAGQ